MRRFAKPLYGLTPVPRVRIPPSPPDVLSPVSIVTYLTFSFDRSHQPRSFCTREVHIRCIFERSLKLLHRLRDFGICGLDVAGLGDCYIRVPQESLDSLVGHSKSMKIRR